MTNMISFVHEKAMEKFAGNKVAADAFIAGFCKEAEDSFRTIAAKAGVGLAAGVLGAGLVGAINSYRASSMDSALRQKFERALAQVIANNRVVKGAPVEKAKTYAETIFKFAPNVAADANLLSSILANAVLGEGIDQMTIKNLVDLEGRYRDNTGFRPIPSFGKV